MWTNPLSKRPWVVHKFGGTSVANAECYRRVVDVLENENLLTSKLQGTGQGVVVSTMTGITDALLKTMELAKSKDPSYLEFFREKVIQRHVNEITNLLKSPQNMLQILKRDQENIEHLLRAILITGVLTLPYEELIVGHGEIWSAQILNSLLLELGRKSTWLDARKVLHVSPSTNPNQSPDVNWEMSYSKIDSWFQSQDPEIDVVAITGFIAATLDGTPTTLKRNGSDYSGSIFGALFRAESITIWTDVDGVYSADPRKVPGAVLLDQMSYTEALEFSFYGAKIIHPKTMIPAVRNNIPVWTRNTFNPTCLGTKIVSSITEDQKRSRTNLSTFHHEEEIKELNVLMGFCTIDNLSIVAVKAATIGSKEYAPLSVSERLLNSLNDLNVPLVLTAQAAPEHSILFCVPSIHGDLAKSKIEEDFFEDIQKGHIHSVKLMKGYTILTGVGDNISNTPGTAAKFFTALTKAKVNVLGVAQNGTRVICVLVEGKNAVTGLRILHTEFKLSKRSVAVGLIVDKEDQNQTKFIEQIYPILNSKTGYNLQLVSILASEKMKLSKGNCKIDSLDINTEPSDLKKFINHLENFPSRHKILIDLSNNQQIPEFYKEWAITGVHIISGNKKLSSFCSPTLLSTSQKFSRHEEIRGMFFYELALGECYSLAKTLQHLLLGDEILEMEGTISSSWSYILNTLFSTNGSEKKFSSLVKEAVQNGFVGSDVFYELSGERLLEDLRVLHCFLSSQSPFINEKVVVANPLDPQIKRTETPDDIFNSLKVMDEVFNKIKVDCLEKGEVLRFVTTFTNEKPCQSGLKRYPLSHPFANLQDTERLFIVKTLKTTMTLSLQEPFSPNSLPLFIKSQLQYLLRSLPTCN